MNELSDIDLAKQKTVKSFKGGATALAPLLNIHHASVLSNKVNPHNETHHLTVNESVTLQAITQNFSILHACANVLGFVCVPIPTEELQDTSDMELLTVWAEWQAEAGETAQEIRNALKDKKITQAELKKIKKEVFEDIAREMEMLQRLEAVAEE